MADRALYIHIARCYIAQCRARRDRPGWPHFFASAQWWRRRASEIRPEPVQSGLFA